MDITKEDLEDIMWNDIRLVNHPESGNVCALVCITDIRAERLINMLFANVFKIDIEYNDITNELRMLLKFVALDDEIWYKNKTREYVFKGLITGSIKYLTAGFINTDGELVCLDSLIPLTNSNFSLN